jgi:dihydroorotase
VAQRAVKQGFLPDTISTDWTEAGRAEGVIDFPNCLSKFLLLGMPLDQVIARGTINAARVFDCIQRPRHAQGGCAGGRCGSRAAGRIV